MTLSPFLFECWKPKALKIDFCLNFLYSTTIPFFLTILPIFELQIEGFFFFQQIHTHQTSKFVQSFSFWDSHSNLMNYCVLNNCVFCLRFINLSASILWKNTLDYSLIFSFFLQPLNSLIQFVYCLWLSALKFEVFSQFLLFFPSLFLEDVFTSIKIRIIMFFFVFHLFFSFFLLYLSLAWYFLLLVFLLSVQI